MWRTWTAVLLAGGVLVGWAGGLGADPPAFDRLSVADRRAMQARFTADVWPLLQRGGKDGCVGCHAGRAGGALRMTGDAARDFPMLLKDGYFLPDDAGSLLSRIVDADPKRRMPPGKRPAWTAPEVQGLRDFVTELERRQR